MNIDMLFRFHDRRFSFTSPPGAIYCVIYYRLRRHEGDLVWWNHGSSYSLDSFEDAISKFAFDASLPVYPKILERSEGDPITFLKYDDYPL